MSRLFKVALTVLALSLPALGWAEQGKVAVVDVEGAMLQTDLAQKRLAEIREQEDFKKNAAEQDRIRTEGEALAKKLQKDMAVMSQEQQIAAQKKLTSMQEDLDHVRGKMQQAQQSAMQPLLQEMAPKLDTIIRDLIDKEGIGLLLQKRAAIHASADYDLTAKVTDKLNQLTTK